MVLTLYVTLEATVDNERNKELKKKRTTKQTTDAGSVSHLLQQSATKQGDLQSAWAHA